MNKFTAINRPFIISNLLWVTLMAILLFNYKCSNSNSGNSNCDTFCSNYSNQPLPGLTAQTAITIANNYGSLYQLRTLRGRDSVDVNNRPVMISSETKSVWFSLESLKKFIYHFERNVCQLNCKDIDKNALGIRFYFAKYPDSTTVVNQIANNDRTFDFLTKPNMQGLYGRKTLFIVPTYWDNNHRTDTDFDPQWSIQKGSSFCIRNMRFILNENNEQLKTLRIMAGSPDPNDPNGLQNHNPLCPPDNCPGQSF